MQKHMMQKKLKYEVKLKGKLWANENKMSADDGKPNYKGQLCTVGDIESVTTGQGKEKRIEWSDIPQENKLSISAWDNNGTLNVSISQAVKDDMPF